MYLPPDIVLQQKLFKWSRSLIYAVMAISLLVLVGWQFDIQLLKRVSPGLTAMNPSTSLCFVLSSVSFLLLTSAQKSVQKTNLGYVLAGLVLLIGLSKIGGILFGYDLQLDVLFFTKKVSADIIDNLPNRMSPNTAVCFVLTGIGLLLFRVTSNTKILLSQCIGIFITLLSIVSLLGYLYQVEYFLGFLSHIQMALHTAICFFMIGLAMLFARPGVGIMKELTSQLSGSLIARVLLPAAIIIPALLGLMRLWGYWSGAYNNEFGVVLYAMVTMLLFAGVILYNAALLNRRDLLKKQTEIALNASEEHNRGIFDNAPDSIVMIDEDGRIVKWNIESERLFQWKAAEVLGKLLHETIIPTEFRESHRKGMQRYQLSGQSDIMGNTIDLYAIKKDGSPVDVSLRISPLMLNEKRFFVGFMRDITQLKQIQVKLKTFNEELKRQVEDKTAELTDIFERITDGFIALDKDFRYTYANKKIGEITGKQPADLIGKNVWDVFPDAVGTDTYKAFVQAMKEQQYATNTDHFPQLDLWQENHIYPSANGLSVFIRDISEKRKAEREINKAWTLADKLIDSLPGVFYFYDHTGKFIRWNRQFEVVTGYGPDEIANMHPADFFPEEEKEYITGRITQVFEIGQNDAEAHFVTKDGKWIPHYFKAVMMNYEGKPCLLGTGIDITERKKAEEEVKLSEQKYKLLFESSPLSMWMLSLPDYNIIEVNEATLRQYRYQRDEFLRMDIFDLRTDADIEKVKRNSDRSFRGIFYAGVWQHQRKDGGIIYVDVITHDIYYEGKPVRLVLANEVTEQYLAEEKLKQSYESIRQLTEHLNEVREQERLHIAREIHDELGQLLTVLKMDVSWLSKKVDASNKPVKDKIGDLTALIDTTVKTVRRIASELRPSLLDDLGLLAAMEWHIEEFERRSGIFGEARLPEEELKLPDSLKIGLFRIMQESLTNVARHSGAKKVSVKLIQENNQLILTIADDGKGFDEEKSKKKTLGLLGMKERTLVMGGEYHINSKPGSGTTVTVRVPFTNN